MELESIHNPTGHFFPKVYQKENKIPTPSHRHAAPSAPWPWINTHDGELNAFFLHSIAFITCLAVDPVQLESRLPPVPPLCDHKSCNGCWKGYPQSRFPNWTKDQVSRSKIADAITNYCSDKPCIIYRADVRDDGFFENVDSVTADDRDRDATWNIMVHTQVCGSLVLYDVCSLCVTRHLYSVFFCLVIKFWQYHPCSVHQTSEFERCSSRIYRDLFSKCLEQGGMFLIPMPSLKFTLLAHLADTILSRFSSPLLWIGFRPDSKRRFSIVREIVSALLLNRCRSSICLFRYNSHPDISEVNANGTV